MAAGDLITLPWQLELAGVLMGDGTDFVVRSCDLWSAPQIRATDVPRSGTHGLAAGERERFGGRQVAASFYITGDTDTVEVENRQMLQAAWAPSETDAALVPLVWMEDDGRKYRVHGRPRGASVRVEPRMPADCRFLALDPRIYDNDESTSSTALGTLTGGLSFPAAAPFVFGTSGTSAVMACDNVGTTDAPWTATFAGPLTAPELVHVESGSRMSFPSAVLAAGESLVVDSDSRTVLLNGTASRYSWLAATSQWFDLQPASIGTNSVQLLGSAGAGTVTIAWRSAWI